MRGDVVEKRQAIADLKEVAVLVEGYLERAKRDRARLEQVMRWAEGVGERSAALVRHFEVGVSF